MRLWNKVASLTDEGCEVSAYAPLPVLPSKIGRMEYSQVVRHRFLISACKGSNPFTPDYEQAIVYVKKGLRRETGTFPAHLLKL